MLVFDCEAQMFYHSDIMKRSLRFVSLSINFDATFDWPSVGLFYWLSTEYLNFISVFCNITMVEC